MCEGPESGKSWVLIGNKEKPQSRGGKISGWEVSGDRTVQGPQGHGEWSGPYAKPVGSPEVWCV